MKHALQDLVKQAKLQGYLEGLQAAVNVAHGYDEGSILFSGFTWPSYIEALEKRIKELSFEALHKRCKELTDVPHK
jgi:hypothetical protein